MRVLERLSDLRSNKLEVYREITSTDKLWYLVNDSPALKRADVGFAMGSGTAVAKEAGDIVIIDDNFKSIRNAVLYGRTIYHNILKFCKFQLAINVGAVLTSAIMVFFGVEEPLTVTQLLFVNLCMDSLGSLLLGKEPADEKYMKEKPRRRDESIVSKPMFIQFTIVGIYLLALSFIWFKVPAVQSLFSSEAEAKAAYFAVFMFTAILNGLNVRRDDIDIFKDIKQNTQFFPVMAAMLVATVVITEIGIIAPSIGNMFGTVPVGLVGWIAVIVASVLVIPFDIVRKLVTKAVTKQ